MYWDNRKKLLQSPVVGHRAKDREVCQIFGAEQTAQIVKLFRHILFLLREAVRLFANVPEKNLAFTTVFERNQAEIEHRKEFFALFERVVIILAIVFRVQSFAQIVKLFDDLR